MARQQQFTLTVGELISKSFGIYARNFIPFLVLSALLMSPWAALRLYAETLADPMSLNLPLTLVSMLLTYMLTGTLTYGVVQQMRGKPANLSSAVSKGMQALPRALGTGILVGLRVFVFTLLLIIPGIREATRLYVAIPAAIMEGKGGSRAVERSMTLTDGSRWPVFGSWFIMLLLGIGPIFIVAYVLATVSDSAAVPVWVEIGTTLLVQPLSAVAMAVCYFLLRQGKEQVSADEIAAVFD